MSCDIDNDSQTNNTLDEDAEGDSYLDGDEILARYNPADSGDHPTSVPVPAIIWDY